MTTTTAGLQKKVKFVSPSRQRWMGGIQMALAMAIWVIFSRSLESGVLTTFLMTPGGTTGALPNWVFSTLPALNTFAMIAFSFGAYQFFKGFGKRTNLVLSIVVGLFVFSFLSWATAEQSINLAGLLRSTVVRAVPIALGAFAAMINERAGVVNIAIEGNMLAGALVSAIVGSLTNLWIGLIAAILVGALLAWAHGILSIKYKTDQIISSTTILIFATGMTSFISARFLHKYQNLNAPGIFQRISIPFLSEIPFIGPILFDHNIFIYAMYIFLFVIYIALFQTRWGLRLRAVGEHPKAADTLGINVIKTRYMAVILSGMMGGFAGAYFVLGSVGRFDEMMTAGRGFIGLAAMIFGNWSPFGSFGAALLFGFTDSLASKLAILGVNISSEFLLMTPYIATMIVLAGVVGRGQMPAASGKPYEKE